MILFKKSVVKKADLINLGFRKEEDMPKGVDAWCMDAFQDEKHYKRLRVFNDRKKVLIFKDIPYKYSKPTCDPDVKSTGVLTFEDTRHKNTIKELKNIIKYFRKN